MSAFLAPIHFRMYRKIRAQEDLTKAIAALAAEHAWLTEEEAAAYGKEEPRPLEDIIDLSNIHGWLLGKIEDAETRYAKLITHLLKEDAARFAEIKNTAFAVGAAHAPKETSPRALYSALDELLLDGMPCDGACMVTDSSDANFTWELRLDVHGPFWTKAGGKAEHYYTLREKLMEGFLSQSNQRIVTEDRQTYHFAEKE